MKTMHASENIMDLAKKVTIFNDMLKIKVTHPLSQKQLSTSASGSMASMRKWASNKPKSH